MCVHDARAEKWWMARRWRGWRQRGRVGDTRVETAESGAVRAGRGARAASHGGGKVVGEEQQPGGERERERAERELTPLPRHQIASFSPLSPSLAGKRQRGGAPSSSPAAAAPPPLGRRKETCRGWRVGGKGVYNWRRAYARRRAPCEERRGKRVEGPVEKREAIAKKRRERERGDEEICYPQDSSLHARHRVVRAHTERGFSSTLSCLFSLFAFYFFSAPPLARMLVFTC